MTWLEPRSVIVISSVLAVVTLFILVSLRRNIPPNVKGVDEWVAAYVAFIAAMILLVLRGIAPPILGVVVADTLIISAIILFGLGLQRFYGEQPSNRPLVLGGAVVLVGLTVINFVVQSYPLRLAFVTSALLCAYAVALWRLRRHASGRFGERVTQLSFIIPFLGTALRLLTVGDVGHNSQLFKPSPVQSLYVVSLGIGALLAGVGFILMVNERTRAELEKLARSLERTTQELRQQNEVKSKFLAYAGHDIRQPLQAMHLLLAGLTDSGLTVQQLQTARLMESSVNALTDMLNALLDISRLEAGAIKPVTGPVDLDVVLTQLVQEFLPQAAAKGLRLRLRLPPGEAVVQADEQLLASVLRNLLGNAIKYTQSGGVLLTVRKSAQGYRLQVWDTGIGIPAEHLSHVFEEYYQVDNPQRDRSKGLGLGLAIVHRMSVLMDLKLACRSRPGQGTVMEITLPFAAGQQPGEVRSAHEAGTLNLGGVQVVVVEDDAAVAQALKQWLRARGALVWHYTTAEEALAAPEVASADVVLSDYRLPGGMSGLDFLNALRERALHDIRGALLTGETSRQFIEQVAASGWPLLFKPVHPRELQAMLRLLRMPA